MGKTFPRLAAPPALHQYNAGTNIFRHKLGERETRALLELLAHPELAPVNVLPYETNGYKRSIPENPKFREQSSAQDFPGFDWENPVLSSFEDWVLGWVIQTGLLLLSSF